MFQTYHASSQSCIGGGLVEHLGKVIRHPSSTGGDDRNLDGRLDVVDQFQVKAAVAAILINAIEQDFSSPHGLDSLHDLPYIHVPSLPTTFDGALVPAEALSGCIGSGGLQSMMLGVFGPVNVNTLGIDTHDDGLFSVCLGNRLDRGAAAQLLAGLIVLLGGKHCI